MNERKEPPHKAAVTFSPEELELLKVPFSREESERSQSCVLGSTLKFSLPLALLSQVFLAYKKTGEPVTVTRRGINFAVWMFMSVILFKPTCDYLIRANRIVQYRQKKEEQGELSPGTEDSRPLYQQDDLGYPSDLMTNLDHTESFSADFNSTKLDLDDHGEAQKAKGITYQELRERHRGKPTQPVSTSSNLYFESEKTPSLPVVRNEEPENPRPRKLNKYGDEME